MAFEWDRIGQPHFDRVVEALVHRLYSETAEVRAVNGRGGDGGRDIDVVQGGRLRIYQLKYFPDGLQGRGRRPSIKKSFKRAMEHDPYEWVLVVPCTLTPGERAFVMGLAEGRGVKVTVMDRTVLDDRLATHSDIEHSLSRTGGDGGLLEYAKIMNREQDILAGGMADLSTRVQALGRVVDDLDPNWTVDFAREGDKVVQTLGAKHPRAQEVSPITMSIAGTSMDADLAAAVTRSLGFGVAEPVELPPDVVERLTVSGPDWIAQTFTNTTVSWKPISHVSGADAAVSVAFLGEDGSVQASYAGRLKARGAGSLGSSIEVDLPGALLRVLRPFDESAPAKLTYQFDLAGLGPAEALKVLRLRRRLSLGGDFRVMIDGQLAGAGCLPESGTADDLRRWAQLQLFLEDLEVVQRHCEQDFPIPADMSMTDRIALRMARLLIEGRCVASPFSRELTITLTWIDDANTRELLSGRPQSLRVTSSEYGVTIAGHLLDLGSVCIFHTEVTADDGPAILESLRSGRVSEATLVLRPARGEHYRMFLTDSPDDGMPLSPCPLGLDGFPTLASCVLSHEVGSARSSNVSCCGHVTHV
ncbi:hypothetical protein ACWGI1_23880 [Streptomyces sp. NPDC054835]|uniref:hypothetical protein n=1 Tax=Streptomyces exfoliatus TaxID=1905 RepID=UPI0004632DEC|nr:hypothetical protein [Streptomyces exfoliatus]